MPILESGQLFERYRITRCLGSGISGESYEAEDSILLRKVTLKLVHPHTTLPDAARRQFFREMQRISIFNHPYLAPILDYGEIHGQLYVARRYVSPGSLLGAEGRLWFRPPLGLADAIRYTRHLADALNYMHQQGYIHGALTFSNILVLHGPDLENDAAPFLISDTGLAQFVRRYGQPAQTPLPITAAPEQFDKRLTPASDQFALAVLLYFWLAGRPPFLGTPEEIELKKRHEMLTPLSSLNPHITLDLDGVLLRALSAAPEYRYPSVQAFADSLHHTLKYLPEVTEPTRFPSFITPVQTPFLSLFTEATEPIAATAENNIYEPFSSATSSSSDGTHPVEAKAPAEMGTIPETEPPTLQETGFPLSPTDDETLAEQPFDIEAPEVSQGEFIPIESAPDSSETLEQIEEEVAPIEISEIPISEPVFDSVGTRFIASTNNSPTTDSPTTSTGLTSPSDIGRDEARPYNTIHSEAGRDESRPYNTIHSEAGRDEARPYNTIHSEAGRDESRPYNTIHSEAGRDEARPYNTIHSEAGRDESRPYNTIHSEAGRDEARPYNTIHSEAGRDEARPYNDSEDTHTTSIDHESALETKPDDMPIASIAEIEYDEAHPSDGETAIPLVDQNSDGAEKPTEKPEVQPPTEPIPEPTPQIVPGVPQPLPEPALPEPLPDTGQREQQQEQEQPPSEEPTVIPPPQPLPDIQQPVPDPETPTEPPVQPPSKEAESNAEQKSLLTARLIIASPYAEEPYEIPLEREEYTIGRAGSSDILLDQDNLTSRHHALLRHEENRYLLYDRRSANGVYVNGQKISSEQGAELLDGDHISIGNYELIFRCPPPDISNDNGYQESSEPKMTYSI